MSETGKGWFIVGVFALLSFGVFGCTLALFVLSRIKRNGNNERHRFLLRCLIANDCVELVFMLTAYVTTVYWPETKEHVFVCFLVFVLRFCGLASGCVAVVMAVERWLALTKPFFYETHITYSLLKRTVFMLLLTDLILTCVPLLQFSSSDIKGLKGCNRLRDSKDSFDVAYAYLVFVFSAFLWVAIAYMNINVMKALCMKEEHNQSNNVTCVGNAMASARKEETAYAWLMLSLCFTFVVPWAVQMIAFVLSQLYNDGAITKLERIADLLIIIQFTMDPYLYVLQQRKLVRLIFKRPANRIMD